MSITKKIKNLGSEVVPSVTPFTLIILVLPVIAVLISHELDKVSLDMVQHHRKMEEITVREYHTNNYVLHLIFNDYSEDKHLSDKSMQLLLRGHKSFTSTFKDHGDFKSSKDAYNAIKTHSKHNTCDFGNLLQ